MNFLPGSGRLLNAVSSEQLVNEILAKGYKRVLAEVAPDGTIIFKELYASAKVIGTFTP